MSMDNMRIIRKEFLICEGVSYRISTSYAFAGLEDGVVEVTGILTDDQVPQYVRDTKQDMELSDSAVEWVRFTYKGQVSDDIEGDLYLPLEIFVDHISTL